MTNLDDPDTAPTYRPCDICREPLLVGQHRRHYTCCAASPTTPAKVCNPVKVKGDDVRRCAHCWAPAT